ncbi:unnamed protein product [Linum tenue]|uniref:Uncharacterized protein n=1 Tax=Linum tenue TaxID=586396 RepID=A0AAV0NU70_9ROSI|nr:unnamed protein product [Linum tenue]
MKSKALVSSFLELLIFEAHASLWACFSFTTAEEFNTGQSYHECLLFGFISITLVRQLQTFEF